ncbi:CAP domain-containing protein [Streptomyces sp. NPDC000134]|uniref:CAP domain-containing protein n=1 Tax=Streptomyces sp. NPDC000134 TaxID=3364536 RepID=UPI0036894FF0
MGRHRRSAAGRAATGRAAGGAQQPGPGARRHDGRQHSYPESHPTGDRTTGDRPTGDRATGDRPAGDSPARGVAPYLDPGAYAEARARSDAYLYGADGSAEAGVPTVSRTVDFPGAGFTEAPRRPGSHRRRKKRAAAPVRTGLLGISAAVALGTIAVATGLVPGLDGYRIGGDGTGSGSVRSADSPSNTPGEQGGAADSPESGATGPATGRTSSPSSPAGSPSKASSSPTRTPSKEKDGGKGKPEQPKKPKTTPGGKQEPGTSPSRAATEQPAAPPAAASGQATSAEAEVLRLVNEERAKAGCTPVTADGALAELAESFSRAMAAQGFFDHTDPSGATPWDRAEAAGISNLGGENIARGQADAQAVMDAWMNSEGHRANILNCDFTTLGVGVQFGSGGPWWTQDFGY